MHLNFVIRSPARFGLLIGMGAVILAAKHPAELHAQRRGARPLPLRGTGEVLGIRPGLLQVQHKPGDTWLMQVKAAPDTITVKGMAEPSFLRKGMFVRFTAMLDAKGKMESPVEELSVFTPHPGFKLGVILESEQEPTDEEAKKKRRRSKRGFVPGQYLVAGRLTAISKDTITVSAGKRVTAKLAENAMIRVDVIGDYSLVKKGDSVEFRGIYYQPGQGIVNYVAFTLQQPLKAEEQAKDNASPKRKRAATKKSSVAKSRRGPSVDREAQPM